MKSEGELAWVARAEARAGRQAVVAGEGSFRYDDLLADSANVARHLLDGRDDLEEARVAYLVHPSFTWLRAQWGIWRAGGVAVPLCISHPTPELEYVVADSDAEIIVAQPEFKDAIEPVAQRLGRRLQWTDRMAKRRQESELPSVDGQRRAMIVYTSGSTGKPKGVVTTHRNLESQMESLIEAWEWRPEDRIMEVLPLHHVHGIVNVVGCALWCGAVCDILPYFDARMVWLRLASFDYSLFMAVPTIYVRLIAVFDAATTEEQERWTQGVRRLRLMVSGSAALPVTVLERWREITGHRLLERYGMTETGMILSNPLRGERRPGFVGTPLPRVEVRLRGDDGELSERQGEVEVRGPGVFREYWRRPEETAAAFDGDWFRTGDVAVVEEGSYRLLGRRSVDILKTGGYKVSALEIEETLRQHPAIAECAVVGVADEEWGERVAAAVVCGAGECLSLERLREWGKARLAPYKVPSRLLVLEALPRNALGKVTKPDVTRLFEEAER